MSKKEEFKDFVRKHPELVNFIKSKEMTWQDFYNIYDIYGTEESAWNKYFNGKDSTQSAGGVAGLGELTNLVKNINMDNIQKHIKTAQKAISVIQELTGKTAPNVASNIVDKTPRPLNKFFED